MHTTQHYYWLAINFLPSIDKYTCIVNDNNTILRVITKLPNSEQSSKGKVKTHKYINRQNQSIITLFSKPILQRLQSESVQINTK